MDIKRASVILNPNAIQRGLIKIITNRFGRKGVRLACLEMI